MIHKFFVYCQSDGLLPALAFTCKTLFGAFLGPSITRFFRLRAYKFEKLTPPDLLNCHQVFINELNKINFPRLKELPCRRWLEKGSRLYVTFTSDNRPVAFTWTHFGHYAIHGLGNVHLSDNECWIGPTFVHKKFRGHGLNKAQIHYQMTDVPGMTFYTSVNSKNKPSICSFLHFGFSEIGRTVMHKSLFSGKTNITAEGEIKEKISLQ